MFSEKTEVLVLNAGTDVQSRPGSSSFKPLATYMGLSGLDLNVKASCACVDGMLWWAKYQLLHVDVEFVYKVWLRPKSSYRSEDHRRFVRAAEKDHLRDFRAWALTDGKIVVWKAYVDAGKWHDSKKACELAAERLIRSRVDTAFVTPLKESGRYHDRSGRHTWGDENARPIPPASVNVDDPHYFSPSNM